MLEAVRLNILLIDNKFSIKNNIHSLAVLCEVPLVSYVYRRMSYSQQDLLLDSFQDCLIAVYGAMELALRSAEAFNDTLRPSMAQVVFMRVLRLIWLLFFLFFFPSLATD